MSPIPRISNVIAQIAIKEREIGSEDVIKLDEIRTALIELGFEDNVVDDVIDRAMQQGAIRQKPNGALVVAH